MDQVLTQLKVDIACPGKAWFDAVQHFQEHLLRGGDL
jgi:hypothetical protein